MNYLGVGLGNIYIFWQDISKLQLEPYISYHHNYLNIYKYIYMYNIYIIYIIYYIYIYYILYIYMLYDRNGETTSEKTSFSD